MKCSTFSTASSSTNKHTNVNDETFFTPPQNPAIYNLKTHFDDPITNLIDQANNVIQMMPKNKRNEDDNLHLSEQLSKLFHEVDVQRKIEQDDDENIGENII